MDIFLNVEKFLEIYFVIEVKIILVQDSRVLVLVFNLSPYYFSLESISFLFNGILFSLINNDSRLLTVHLYPEFLLGVSASVFALIICWQNVLIFDLIPCV